MLDNLDAEIIRLVDKILTDAINSCASDLHLEPGEKNYRIRIRIDGILNEHSQLPSYIANRFVIRIKVLAQLDIAERRLPQDGHFKILSNNDHRVDLRVSCCPTIHGEKLVLRILDPCSSQLAIDDLGLESFQKELYLKHLNKQQGMILITGPTGSGKTVSLYSALQYLNTPKVNICSIEEPVEINLNGINQTNINAKTGLKFASALRALLRQDPDIIMIGEIRDFETAEIAIKAAQTGHLVLATIHTNSAAEVLSRMISLGIPAYNVAASVSLVISQRLCRILCLHCKIKTLPQKNNFNSYTAATCDKCNDGYKGRTAIYEMLEITAAIRQIIISGGNAIDIEQFSIAEGNWSLHQAAMHKACTGITSFAEVASLL